MFGKKKKEDRPLPIEDVKKMAGRGMSDKDIIKELKHRDYSYNDIEKAMLQAVREGVDDEPSSRGGSGYSDMAPPLPTEDLFAPPPPETDAPAFDEGAAADEVDTTAVLEELIEGVIEDKWHSFEDKFSKMEESFDRIKTEIKHFETQLQQSKNDSPAKEVDMRLGELSQQIEDLDARVGGLEKAFRQFLPSLTRNIESLSQIIHEMKEKGHVEIEEEM